MATEPKAAPAVDSTAADSPYVSGLKFRRETLVKKLAFLGTQKNSADHDVDSAKARAQAGIDQIDRELKGAK